MSTKWPVVLLFGPPGSGKGTQAKNLTSCAPFVHVSSGDIYRAIPKLSELAKTLSSYSSQGLLVPDALTCQICSDYLRGLVQTFRFDPMTQILLLDGLPRTKGQVATFSTLFDVRLILNLKIADENTLVQRLSNRARIEGRADDAKIEVIQKRLSVYHEQTHDVLDEYPRSLIVDIDADQKPLMVLHDIIPHVQKIL